MYEAIGHSYTDDELGVHDHPAHMAMVVGPNGTLVVGTAEGSVVISPDGSTVSIDSTGHGVYHPVLREETPVISEDK